jgi:hypothetical protein
VAISGAKPPGLVGRPAATKLTADRGDYYLAALSTAADKYYLDPAEIPGRWTGALAGRLGLDGLVDAGVFRAVLDGWHPGSGDALTANAGATGRVTGFESHVLGHASPAAAPRYQHAAERRDTTIADTLEAVLQTARPATTTDPADDPCGGRTPKTQTPTERAEDLPWGKRGVQAPETPLPPTGIAEIIPLTRASQRASDGNRTRVLSLGS